VLLAAPQAASGRASAYVVTLIRTDTGQVIDQESDRCDVCRVNEVIRGATLAAVDLLNKAPEPAGGRGPPSRPRKVDRAIRPSRASSWSADHHATRIGIALLAIGLVGAITGAALVPGRRQPAELTRSRTAGRGWRMADRRWWSC